VLAACVEHRKVIGGQDVPISRIAFIVIALDLKFFHDFQLLLTYSSTEGSFACYSLAG
jgi:hypothetical protein